MVSQLTTSLKVTKWGYVEEVTRGSIPSSAAFLSLNTENFTPTSTTNHVDQAVLGSPFIFKRPKTGERYRFALDFSATSRDFLEYCINTSGTKNRDKSLSFGVGQMMDTTGTGTLAEHYYFAKGAICDSVSIEGTNERIGISSEWVPLDVTIPAVTHGIGGSPTWAAPTLAGWTGLSAGTTTPISWNAAPLQVRGYSVSVENAVDEVQLIGNPTLDYSIPTTHRNSFTLDIPFTSTALQSDAKAGTARDLKIQLGPAAFLVFEEAVINEYDFPTSATDTSALTISYAGVARSVTVSAT
jgi:hypothetical protein